MKIFGWVLLLAGILIIIWTLYFSYNIFTGKASVPEIFKIIDYNPPTTLTPPLSVEEMAGTQAQMEKMIGEQLKEILPTEFLPKLFNLIAWSIFAGILIFGGAQISNLGIKLIKK